MKSNQSAICLKREGENTTHIKSNHPEKKYWEGVGLAHRHFEAWDSNHTNSDCKDVGKSSPGCLRPLEWGGSVSLLEDTVRPNSLPSATWLYHLF